MYVSIFLFYFLINWSVFNH